MASSSSFKVSCFSVLDKYTFEGLFYNTWAWWPSCLMDQNHLNKFEFPISMNGSDEMVETCQALLKGDVI